MKKIVRNLFAVIAATALVGSIVSCADSDAEDPFAPVSTNSNAASGSGGETTGGDEQGAGKAKYTNNEITFPVTEASTNAEDTVLLIKYDRSAAGADELIKVTNAGLKVWKNGTLIKTIDTIEFALDEYGSSFSNGGKAPTPISDVNDMKEYKVKLSIGTTVAKDDTIKVKLDEKAVISLIGADAANVNPENVVVALIDKAESAGYYKELCENSDLYKPFLTKNEEAVAPQGGNTESKAEGNGTGGQQPSGNGGNVENSRPAIGETVFTATGADLTIELPVNHYEDADHGIQFAPAGTKYLPKGAKSGEAYKIVMKGTASAEFTANVQFLTAAWTGFGEAINATFTTSAFNIEGTYTFGSDTADGFMFVIGNDDATLTAKTLTLTEFTITRVEGGSTAGGATSATVTPYSTTNLTVTTVTNTYSTSNHGIQAKITVRVGDALKGLSKNDTFIVKMKGTASKAFAPQVFFMDNTQAGGYANLGAWGDTVNFTTEFDISKEVTISGKAPSSDDADAFVFVIDYDETGATADIENVTFNFSEFSVTKK